LSADMGILSCSCVCCQLIWGYWVVHVCVVSWYRDIELFMCVLSADMGILSCSCVCYKLIWGYWVVHVCVISWWRREPRWCWNRWSPRSHPSPIPPRKSSHSIMTGTPFPVCFHTLLIQNVYSSISWHPWSIFYTPLLKQLQDSNVCFFC